MQGSGALPDPERYADMEGGKQWLKVSYGSVCMCVCTSVYLCVYGGRQAVAEGETTTTHTTHTLSHLHATWLENLTLSLRGFHTAETEEAAKCVYVCLCAISCTRAAFSVLPYLSVTQT